MAVKRNFKSRIMGYDDIRHSINRAACQRSYQIFNAQCQPSLEFPTSRKYISADIGKCIGSACHQPDISPDDDAATCGEAKPGKPLLSGVHHHGAEAGTLMRHDNISKYVGLICRKPPAH